jgi:voltage-gated potassium channel
MSSSTATERARGHRRRRLAVAADASSEDAAPASDRPCPRLIAAVSTDAENVYTVLSARLPQARPVHHRSRRDRGCEAQAAAGGATVSSRPTRSGALQIAQSALRLAVVDFVHLATSSQHLDLSMEQVRIDSASPLAGQSFIGVNLRQRFGVVVVGVQRADGRMEFNPAPDVVMQPGDQLVVLGPPEDVKRIEAAAGGAGTT